MYAQNSAESFQSTPPVKAATCNCNPNFAFYYISIHAAREGGDTLTTPRRTILTISIHAAREGGDLFSPSLFVLLF